MPRITHSTNSRELVEWVMRGIYANKTVIPGFVSFRPFSPRQSPDWLQSHPARRSVTRTGMESNQFPGFRRSGSPRRRREAYVW